MGVRKHNSAEVRKEANKTKYFARLNDVPTSPRKMRLVADLVRNADVEQALAILKHSPKEASERLYKLLKSALANWQGKNDGVRMEDAHLYVSEIFVDSARQLKRIRTAPQGRAHRIRKRSNHVTLYLDSRADLVTEVTNN
jgi:large subunit ribosomal protein L22